MAGVERTDSPVFIYLLGASLRYDPSHPGPNSGTSDMILLDYDLNIVDQSVKTLKIIISTATIKAAEIVLPMGVRKNDWMPTEREYSV